MELKNKNNESGSIIRNKVRSVAQDCTQQKDIGYGETFSPVARLKSIRVLITVASNL